MSDEMRTYVNKDVEINPSGGGYVDLTLHEDDRPEDEPSVAVLLMLTPDQALAIAARLAGAAYRELSS